MLKYIQKKCLNHILLLTKVSKTNGKDMFINNYAYADLKIGGLVIYIVNAARVIAK